MHPSDYHLSEAFQLGAFIQAVVHASGDPSVQEEGFQVANARFSVEGAVASALTYELEADFSGGVELKDARIGYRLFPSLRLDVGKFKAPFSQSALTSSAETPFVRRPRVAGALRLGRPVGAMLVYQPGGGGPSGGPVTMHGGVFNGRQTAGDAPSRPATGEHLLLYVARAEGRASGEAGSVALGVNAAYDASAEGSSLRSGLRYGADVHAERAGAFVTAGGLVQTKTPPGSVSAGAHLTVGCAVDEAHLLRTRWDGVLIKENDREEADPVDVAEPTSGASLTNRPLPAPSLVGVGYTFQPASPLRIEIDYLVPLSSPGVRHSSVLVGLQVHL